MKVHVLCPIVQIRLNMNLLAGETARLHGQVNTVVRAECYLVEVMTCCCYQLLVVRGYSLPPLDQRSQPMCIY